MGFITLIISIFTIIQQSTVLETERSNFFTVNETTKRKKKREKENSFKKDQKISIFIYIYVDNRLETGLIQVSPPTQSSTIESILSGSFGIPTICNSTNIRVPRELGRATDRHSV